MRVITKAQSQQAQSQQAQSQQQQQQAQGVQQAQDNDPQQEGSSDSSVITMPMATTTDSSKMAKSKRMDSSRSHTSLATGNTLASSKSGGFLSRFQSSVSGSSFSNANKKPSILRTRREVLYGRLLFCFVLLLVSAILGYSAYQILSASEERAAADRFDSIAERALDMAQLVIEEKKKATDSLALMVGSANPYAALWPNVHLSGYEEIASSLRIVTQGTLSFCPLVTPGGSEQESFERYAYDLFVNQSGYANTTGVSSFGKGIFSFGTPPGGTEPAPDNRFHITSNWTYHYSPRSVLVPFLQSDMGAHVVLMLNVHFEHTRAKAIDAAIECSEERKAQNDYDRECATITDLMWSKTQAKDVDPGPAGLMMVPIYPRKDNTTITGFIVGKQIWHDLLKHGFESDVNGLDVVLRTDSGEAHTYTIENGEASYKGNGTRIESNPKYSNIGTHINPRFFANNTAHYYMDLYSTQAYTQVYTTNNPLVACVAAVLILLGTALLFFGYDYFVRREFSDKKQLLEAKRQFVRFVSHEVRTPLNTVCMGLTLLQHDFQSILGMRPGEPAARVDHARVEEWVQLTGQVFQNAEASVGVLSDLLNYDKIQMGTLTLELSLLPIWQVLERTVHEFKIAAQEKGVQLELVVVNNDYNSYTDEEDTPPTTEDLEQAPTAELRFAKVVGDQVKLVQVFRNLISNGLKFSQETGKLTVRVVEKPLPWHKRKEETVKCGKEEVTVTRRGEILIQVVDQGVGMTREQVNTVFEDGTQFNANKFQAGGGSGLGMNIAKGVVSAHKGKLTADSEGLGHGSTFAVSLALYNSTTDDESESPTSNHGDKDATVRGERDVDFVLPKFRILVVDDALSNRKLCIRLLERNGHTCEGACDGTEAVDMVKESIQNGQPYDCILLDYEMPNMNGPEACEKIRQMGCGSYIAGVTGNCMSEDVDHFRNCGANCVLPKPFRLEALEERWVEDDVTPFAQGEGKVMVRVESGGKLAEMGDELAKSLQSNHSDFSSINASLAEHHHRMHANLAEHHYQMHGEYEGYADC